MQSYSEIPLTELSAHAACFREALQAICESPSFKNSVKSCEFLRHIVLHTLDGDTDELKERLIGMRLLGREATYDTGSDAGVRVRANDVRKRLIAYNTEMDGRVDYTLELPSGTYVPRFLHKSSAIATISYMPEAPVVVSESHPVQAPLTLQLLAAPTVIAFFLCIICMRWQLAREHPFATFWQSAFQRHSVHLYVPSGQGSHLEDAGMRDEIQAMAPFLNLAGQFGSEISLSGDARVAAGDTLISIGSLTDAPASMPHANGTADKSFSTRVRLAFVDTDHGRRIFDRTTSTFYPLTGASAALLTISNGISRSIRIEGTDEASIDSAVRLLCLRDTFPEQLADDISGPETTQILLPLGAKSTPIIFRSSNVEPDAETGLAR